MAVYQSLSVTEVSGSASVATNTSKVRILWQSTQTGQSWNGYTRTAYYYISINGGAETTYSVAYTLPKGATGTILDTTITVNHRDDGSGNISVRTWMDTDISAGVVQQSQSATLTTIARASEISSVADVTLGNKCSVKWTPKAASFRYRLKFSMGSWSYTTGIIHLNNTSAYTYTGYTIPLDAANQIPSSRTGTMTVTLYTYADSGATAQVGSANSKPFTITVPDNSNTKPTVSMTLAPVSSLPSAFAGLYIQGKTKVKATLSATGKYSTSIKSYSMKVDEVSYDSSDGYTSEYLSKYGSFTVYGYATDAREFTGTKSQDINVIAYSKPKITVSACGRCDENGNLSASGTYLKVIANRSYSLVTSGGVQKNFCQIRYRYKTASAASYSEWITILPGNSLTSDQVETGALLGGVLDLKTSYMVQVQAIDDIGDYAETTISVPTDEVYMHRTKNAMGLGKYAEGENLLDVGWDAHFHGEILIGNTGMTLRDYILSVINEGG